MSRKNPKRWSFTAGEKPNRVTVYEKKPGGPIWYRVWDPTARDGEGNMVRRSLKHADQKKAKAWALQEAARLERGLEDIRQERLTLAVLFELYLRHRSPEKSPRRRKADRRAAALWIRWLGVNKRPEEIGTREWKGFVEARRSGEIDARGRRVPGEGRRPVGSRTIEMDQRWLLAVFNWASEKWRVGGRYLMSENPIRGFDVASEKNPARPVATWDRYEAVRTVADQVAMGRVGRRSVEERSYLSEILDLAVETGRRLTPILSLTYADLRLERTRTAPYGAIRWPAETDKQGQEWTAPLSERARAAVDRVLQERPGIGDRPLFPDPADETRPVGRDRARRWLLKSEELAGVEKQGGSLWHAYRRMWATARKHLPPQDVARAGGWTTTRMVTDIYARADDETTLAVVLDQSRVRGVR